MGSFNSAESWAHGGAIGSEYISPEILILFGHVWIPEAFVQTMR